MTYRDKLKTQEDLTYGEKMSLIDDLICNMDEFIMKGEDEADRMKLVVDTIEKVLYKLDDELLKQMYLEY